MGFVPNLSEQFDVLPDAEQRALARRMQLDDKEARDLLILHNLRYVARWARPYMRKDSAEDLFSDGIIGLIQAVDNYDPKISAFSTYAPFWIRLALQRAVYRQHWLYLPVHNHEVVMAIKKLQEQGITEPQEIAERIERPVELIEGMMHFMTMTYPSLDRQHHDSDDDGITLAAQLPDDDIDAYSRVDEQIDSAALVKPLLDVLSPTEREVIELFYGIGQEKALTFIEIAKVRGTSRQAVDGVYKRAMQKLRQAAMAEVA